MFVCVHVCVSVRVYVFLCVCESTHICTSIHPRCGFFCGASPPPPPCPSLSVLHVAVRAPETLPLTRMRFCSHSWLCYFRSSPSTSWHKQETWSTLTRCCSLISFSPPRSGGEQSHKSQKPRRKDTPSCTTQLASNRAVISSRNGNK